MALDVFETGPTGGRLEVLFRNTAATRIAFVVGGATCVGSMYNIDNHVHTP